MFQEVRDRPVWWSPWLVVVVELQALHCTSALLETFDPLRDFWPLLEIFVRDEAILEIQSAFNY